eukprot:CAMPEP_0172503328 /NCGR_PEP_ID=MMETSP1066-20121228/168267_1 /TAXON_ID=671091 /ORGANISM="Coscinodiscus wailesii, Strain CCMP2513" /LENGTH=254 /DNA_ID=CAMNT_0013279021 /DNA_START=324 /DNA_END=1085 /DNA_ORIENTATION=-
MNNINEDPIPETTILSKLSKHAATTPQKTAVTFLTPGANGGTPSKTFTYSRVESLTSSIATHLLSSPKCPGFKRGDRVVLVFPPSPDFMMAFLACLKAGAIAVPVFPPAPHRRDSVAAFSKIVEGCGATIALTNKEYGHAKKLAGLKGAVTRGKSQWPDGLKWIVTDDISSDDDDAAAASFRPVLHPVAFLQYTSGSTSLPKGVAITHANLRHNLEIISSSLGASTETVVVSWLPQYHDMGLIGSYLGVLYNGG